MTTFLITDGAGFIGSNFIRYLLINHPNIKINFAAENFPLMPTNPYSASKAGADRLCYSYYTTYKMPIIILRASNNFGLYQYPEKIIPLFITNALEDKPLPIYGDGLQIRDWLYVEDHCEAIDFLIKKVN